MSWRMKNFEADLSYSKFLFIFCDVGIKRGICFRTIDNCPPCSPGKVYMTRYKIRMKMRFKDIFYSCIVNLCFLNIWGDLSQWIYDNSFIFTLDVISPLSKA